MYLAIFNKSLNINDKKFQTYSQTFTKFLTTVLAVFMAADLPPFAANLLFNKQIKTCKQTLTL